MKLHQATSIFAVLVTGTLLTACTNGALSQSDANEVAEQQLEAATPIPPTESFLASPLGQTSTSSSLIAEIADQIVFTWTSTNATTATSYYTVDSPDTCTSADNTGPFPWFAATTNGSYTLQIASCQQGHTYTYYFLATNSAGQTSQSSVVINVKQNGTD